MKTRWRTRKLRALALGITLVLLLLGWTVLTRFTQQERGAKTKLAMAPPVAESLKEAGVSPQAARRNIYDLNLRELALGFKVSSVYIKPLELERSQGALKKIAKLLDIAVEDLQEKAASEKSFIWAARDIPDSLAASIKGLNLAGVYVTEEEVRLYPQGRHGAHLVGFAKGGQGLDGVEAYYDNLLMGSVEPGAANLRQAGIEQAAVAAQKGASLVLTMDLRTQKYLEKKLASLVKEAGARGGMALILDVESGAIIAATNYPDYDANFFWQALDQERRNRVLTESVPLDGFVPALKLASAVRDGKIPDFVGPETEIASKIIEAGIYKRVVHGKAHLRGGYWQPLPRGAYWSGPEEGLDAPIRGGDITKFAEFLGLSGTLAVDLPVSLYGEAGGADPTAGSWRDSTTLLRLGTAFSRMLNGGRAVVPHILKGVWFEESGQRFAAKFTPSTGNKERIKEDGTIALFNALSPLTARKTIFLEYLSPEKGPEEETVQVELATGETEMVTAEPAKKRFTAVALGAMPTGRPEIVLGLVLDGALVAAGDGPLAAKTASAVLTRALMWHRATNKDGVPKSRLQADEVFTMWSRLHKGGKGRSNGERQVTFKMPRVVGMSLRKALRYLEDYDLLIEVRGHGRVARQDPGAGSSFKAGAPCTLVLEDGR